MRTIIVDDEEFARKRIATLVEKMNRIEVIAECDNGATAIKEINRLKPDLVFLDINVRDMDGFQVLEQLTIEPRPLVVFITAHDDFALKAFDYEAFDYLVKPFKEERFFKMMDNVMNNFDVSKSNFELNLKKLLSAMHQEEKHYLTKMAIKQGNKTILVATHQINYILSSGVYVEIYTDEAKYVHRESLNNLENQLDPTLFLRVHRSAILNLNAVKEIVHSEYSEIDAKMKDNTLISISKTQKKEFLNKLGV